MRAALAFGPLRCALALDGVALPPELERWRVGPAPGDVELLVRPGAALEAPDPEGFAGDGYAVSGDVVTVAPGRPRALVTALAALLAQRAPRVGCVVLHCAAVRVTGGVALFFAPPGTGKTTFAARSGGRSFAHNAVVASAEPAPAAWAFPFAGDPRPELDATGAAAVRALARLERAERPGFEWLPRSGATTLVMRHCARAPARDALAGERFVIASALALGVPFGRAAATRGPRDLDPIDSAFTTEPLP